MTGSLPTCPVSRTIGHVHIHVRKLPSTRAMAAQVATAIINCAVDDTPRGTEITLTINEMATPSKVPRIRSYSDIRVSCQRSWDTTSAEMDAQTGIERPVQRARL